MVFISSIAGMHPWTRPHYGAAKAAESHLAGSLARELAPHGIRVNAISPGSVDTPMLRIAGVEGPALEPASVARFIMWLASPESAPLSGANLRMDP